MTLAERREVQKKHFKNELDAGYFPTVYAMDLQCTYGIPAEITDDIARRNGFPKGVNMDEFSRFMEIHKARSRASAARLFCH